MSCLIILLRKNFATPSICSSSYLGLVGCNLQRKNIEELCKLLSQKKIKSRSNLVVPWLATPILIWSSKSCFQNISKIKCPSWRVAVITDTFIPITSKTEAHQQLLAVPACTELATVEEVTGVSIKEGMMSYTSHTLLQMFNCIPHTWQVTAFDALQICIHPEKLSKFVVNHQCYGADQPSGKKHFSLCAIEGCTLNLGSSLLHVGEVHVPENKATRWLTKSFRSQGKQLTFTHRFSVVSGDGVHRDDWWLLLPTAKIQIYAAAEAPTFAKRHIETA